MKFPKDKKVFFSFLILTLSALAIFFTVGFLTLSKVATPLPKWLKQASSLRQLGQVLLIYLQEHEGKMPNDIHVLKKWADSNSEFKSLATSPIWSFVSPNDDKMLDWVIGDISKGFYLYAPEVCIGSDGVQHRLVLSAFNSNRLHYEFIEESDFKKLESSKDVK